MDLQQTLSAGVAVEYTEKSDFFRVFDFPQPDLTVIFYDRGQEIARAENIGEGYSEKFDQGLSFDRVRLESPAGGLVHFVTRLGGTVGYDKAPTGNVTVIGGGFTQGRATVTNAPQQLAAANGARKYLMIQNNDPGGTLRVTVDGSDPTAAAGFKVEPGQVFELPFYCATGEVRAMMEAATAAVDNVEFCEG